MRILTGRDGRPLEVRLLTAADTAALRAFDASLSPRSRHLFLPHQYDDATLSTLVARSATGEDVIFLAWDGETVAGYYFLWYAKRPVALLGIGFTDSAQGQGFGRQAMTHLIDTGRELGLQGIELTTDLTNEAAYALYEQCGFRYLRDVENVVGDGSIRIERAMFLPLVDGASPMTEPHAPPV